MTSLASKHTHGHRQSLRGNDARRPAGVLRRGRLILGEQTFGLKAGRSLPEQLLEEAQDCCPREVILLEVDGELCPALLARVFRGTGG